MSDIRCLGSKGMQINAVRCILLNSTRSAIFCVVGGVFLPAWALQWVLHGKFSDGLKLKES